MEQQISPQIQQLLYRRKERVKNILSQRFGPTYINTIEEFLPQFDKILRDDGDIGLVVERLGDMIMRQPSANRNYPILNRSKSQTKNMWGAIMTHQDDMQRMVDEEAKQSRSQSLQKYRADLDQQIRIKERSRMCERVKQNGELGIDPISKGHYKTTPQEQQKTELANLYYNMRKKYANEFQSQNELDYEHRQRLNMEKEQADLEATSQLNKARALQRSRQEYKRENDKLIEEKAEARRRERVQAGTQFLSVLEQPSHDRYWKYAQRIENDYNRFLKSRGSQNPDSLTDRIQYSRYNNDQEYIDLAERIEARQEREDKIKRDYSQRMQQQAYSISMKNQNQLRDAKLEEKRQQLQKVQSDLNIFESQRKNAAAEERKRKEEYGRQLKRQAYADKQRYNDYETMDLREQRMNSKDIANFQTKQPYMSSNLPGMHNLQKSLSPARLNGISGAYGIQKNNPEPFASVKSLTHTPSSYGSINRKLF